MISNLILHLRVLNAGALDHHTTSLIISQCNRATSEYYSDRLLVNGLQHKTEVMNW